MKKLIRKCSGLLSILILLVFAAQAQSDESCKASAPAEVAVGQQFKYTISTDEKGEIISSDFGKFEMVSGPSVGSSTSISMMNGKVEQNTSYTYTYYLVGNKEGEFTIPGVTVSFDGRIVKSNYVIVKVVKAPKIAQQEERTPNDSWFNWEFQMPEMEWPFSSRVQPQQKQDKVQIDDKIGKDDIFIKATSSQLEAYQGEAVVVTHKLYVKQEFRRYAIERANFAPTNDMWLEGLDLGRAEESTETVNGKSYSVFVVKQTAVYPTKTGKLTIPKLTLALRISVPATVKDPFWGSISTTRRKDVTLTSNDLTLKVKALPGTRSDKTEVVGNFTISSNMNKTETHVNEPVTLVVTISGTGNLHHIAAEDLGIDFPADCDVTYPRITGNISAKSDLVTGSKTFRYTIIPRSEGTFLIPGATYTYYNYDMGTYKTISSPDYQLEVLPPRADTPSDRRDSDTDQKPKSNVKTYKI